MKRTHLIIVVMFLFVLFSVHIQSQINLAEWDFNYNYNTSVSGDSTYYTPNGTEGTSDVSFSNTSFGVYPNSSFTDMHNYLLSGQTTGYYHFRTGYENSTLMMRFDGPTTVTNYADGNSHSHYFQFSFPTTGYENIQLIFSIAGGQNDVNDFLEVVFSTDDGETWADAGAYNVLSGWWLYQEYVVDINAKNKPNVLVRLIAGSENVAAGINFYIDYFKVSGTEYSGGASVDASSTITWAYSAGEAGQSAIFSEETSAYYSADWVSNGSNLYYAQTRTEDAITYTLFNPYTQTASASDIDLVSFNVRPKTGLQFTPTSISFDAIRLGTNSGHIKIVWKSPDGTLTTIEPDIQPVRNGQGNDPNFFYDLSSFSIPVSDGEFGLNIYIFNLGDTKQVGLANIEINGSLQGTIADVSVYKLNSLVSPADAGSVTTFPVGVEFDEGTEITLTAATNNFGYQFKQWQDGNGNILSTDQSMMLTITSDTTIIAVYEELTTYSLSLNILGSKWGEIALSPEPVEGKFEKGTTVVMEVIPNPVTTFSYWDDFTTETRRTIVMSEDTTINATFDEIPFIVGWDFNPINPKSSRAGDYYSETTNTGLLNVHKQNGTSTGWLGHTGSFSPKLPCAYLWTAESEFDSDRHYWEASFSTIGYSKIEVKSLMAGSYQHYQIQKIQGSINGTEYHDLNSVEISGAWSELNAVLPMEYEGQEKIYIRWIADTNSNLVSAGTGNDGTAITNIFVFADKEIINDTVAPVLISTVPFEGADNATANGSIVLTFNEKMKVGSGGFILGSETLSPSFGSKTVTFPYSRLEYNSNYTFTIPEGALTDMSGNEFEGVIISFKTMSRPVPSQKLFNAVIAKDGSGDFTTIQEAIDDAPTNLALPYLIFIKNGIYYGHVDIPSNKPYIHLIGQSRDSVVITHARLAGATDQYPDSTVYHVSVGATAVINSSNCYFENITFENKFGYDNTSGPQALALYTIGDRIILKNCWLRSYQDTYLTTYANATNRHYLQNCRIEGAVDFIYGGGDVFFDECTIYCTRESGGYIVAPSHEEGTKWGYVFSHCTIDGPQPNYTTYYGRPWHNAPKASFFNTTLKINIYPVGWYYTMGAIPAIFADYNTMDKDGNPVDLSQRINEYEYYIKDEGGNVTETVKGTAKNSFTDEEAALYTYDNVTSGGDNWDPRIITETTEAASLSIHEDLVTWDPVDYAICYVIIKNDSVLGFTTSTSYSVSGKGRFYIMAVSEYGALSVASNVVTYGINTPIGKTGINENVEFWQHNNQAELRNLSINSTITGYSLNGVKLFMIKNVSNSLSLSIKQHTIIQVKSENNVAIYKALKY